MIFDKNIAYSNLFQVIKTKTSAGFVPNFAAGGQSSEDRTEPPVGAKTVLSIYNKYKEKRIFDDLNVSLTNAISENNEHIEVKIDDISICQKIISIQKIIMKIVEN